MLAQAWQRNLRKSERRWRAWIILYCEWGRLGQGRLVHSKVSRDEAQRFIQAMRKYRRLRRLLRKWQQESVQAMLAESVGQA